MAQLQGQLNTFRAYYNNIRPHRALTAQTPAVAFTARLKAGPTSGQPSAHFRVRQDKVDKSGKVTLRHFSRLYHIGVGRPYKGQAVRILVAGTSAASACSSPSLETGRFI